MAEGSNRNDFAGDAPKNSRPEVTPPNRTPGLS
jgi:hypothetical protein